MSIIVIEGSNGAGKTTVIKNMQIRYNFVSSKSVPDWYRKYIPFARSLAPELQKQVYMIGHEANYLSFNEDENYVLDRFFYSTIIRLNYELKRSVSDTVNEILKIQILPDIVIYLNTDKKIVLNRLIKREGFTFDDILFEYENEVFKQLSKKCDTMIIVDNNNNINNTINEIDNELRLKKILLKRR